MTNGEIAQLLRRVAVAYSIRNENRFKIIAYERAASAIEETATSLRELWKAEKLGTIAGVGQAIKGYLNELFKTGKVQHFTQVLKDISPAIFPLLTVPGLGVKRAHMLVKQFGLTREKDAIPKLLSLAKEGKIATLAGFGEKSQQDIIEAIGLWKKGQIKENRMPLPYAQEMAAHIIAYLKKHEATKQVMVLGSLRRRVSTIGDIDIAVATDNPEKTNAWILKYPEAKKVIEEGPRGVTLLLGNGRQVDVRVQSSKTFGAMLQYFTGNKNHNIKLRELALKKGWSLSEYGFKPLQKDKKEIKSFATEEEVYQFLGLPWIAPELREDGGEIEAAIRHALPKLVEVKDMKGDLHIHSNYPIESSHDMGASPLPDLLHQAEALGYEYIGISDHNPSVSQHTEKEICTILKERKSKFDHIISSTKNTRVHLLTMLEIDIRPDGRLSIPDEAFEYLDCAIVSIHSGFQMKKEEMTKRILTGLSHPKAKILAHPSGRLLGKRPGYDVDWSVLFSFCQKQQKAIEINSFPQRLDLVDVLVRQAIEQQVKLVINTDSHAVSHMTYLPYGVSVARRGWATTRDILNTFSYNEIHTWLTGK